MDETHSLLAVRDTRAMPQAQDISDTSRGKKQFWKSYLHKTSDQLISPCECWMEDVCEEYKLRKLPKWR
jgi:hypothetical protein